MDSVAATARCLVLALVVAAVVKLPEAAGSKEPRCGVGNSDALAFGAQQRQCVEVQGPLTVTDIASLVRCVTSCSRSSPPTSAMRPSVIKQQPTRRRGTGRRPSLTQSPLIRLISYT